MFEYIVNAWPFLVGAGGVIAGIASFFTKVKQLLPEKEPPQIHLPTAEEVRVFGRPKLFSIVGWMLISLGVAGGIAQNRNATIEIAELNKQRTSQAAELNSAIAGANLLASNFEKQMESIDLQFTNYKRQIARLDDHLQETEWERATEQLAESILTKIDQQRLQESEIRRLNERTSYYERTIARQTNKLNQLASAVRDYQQAKNLLASSSIGGNGVWPPNDIKSPITKSPEDIEAEKQARDYIRNFDKTISQILSRR